MWMGLHSPLQWHGFPKAWSDGTSHLLLSPMELLEKRAALVPPPLAHLLRYHGVLAPRARDCDRIVPTQPVAEGPASTPVRVRRLTSSAMGAGEPYGERRPQWSQRGPGWTRYGPTGNQTLLRALANDLQTIISELTLPLAWVRRLDKRAEKAPHFSYTSTYGNGMRILTDLTRRRLVRALQSNHRDWNIRQARARQTPNEREGELVWISGEIHDIQYPLLKAKDCDEVLTRALRRMRGREVCCELGPACAPRNLMAHLLTHGFALPPSSLAGMACLLRDLPEENLGPPKLRVETVTDFAIFDHHRHPFHRGGEWRSVATALIQVRPKRVWHFLAWLNDRPIGSSTLLIARGVAGIYDVGVLAEYRRQGIGAEITAAACHFAARVGLRVAVLISSPMGQSPYRRAGFEEICRIEGCNLSVEAQQEAPLSPREKLLFLAAHDGRHNELQAEFKKHPERIRLKNPSGVGLLDMAAYAGQLEVAEWLLDQGAAMNPITAYELGWADRIPEMTRTDPDVVSRRVGNLSPLHIAILRRDTGEIRDMELVRILVECGADLAAVDDQHRSTPLGWAQAFNDEEAIEFLRSHGSPG